MISNSDSGFTHMLGFHGRKMEQTADGKLIVEFFARARMPAPPLLAAVH
jgi:hypothetical protein